MSGLISFVGGLVLSSISVTQVYCIQRLSVIIAIYRINIASSQLLIENVSKVVFWDENL